MIAILFEMVLPVILMTMLHRFRILYISKGIKSHIFEKSVDKLGVKLAYAVTGCKRGDH